MLVCLEACPVGKITMVETQNIVHIRLQIALGCLCEPGVTRGLVANGPASWRMSQFPGVWVIH